jgi:hypothetical protein
MCFHARGDDVKQLFDVELSHGTPMLIPTHFLELIKAELVLRASI